MTAPTEPPAAPGAPTLVKRLTRLAVVLGMVLVLQAGLIVAFVTASRNPQPHHLAVAIVGTPGEVAPLKSRLSSTDAFTLTPEPTLAAAQDAIHRQQVYGALVPGGHPVLLVASAASPLVAQVLTKALTPAAEADGGTLTVTDVAPLPASDPRGVAGTYLVLGLLIGGYAGAMVIGRLIGMRSPSAGHLGLRLAVLACYALVAGALGVTLVDPALGVVHGHAIALAATGALLVFAVGCFTSALQTLLGLAGTLLSVIALVIIGNPASGGGQIPPALMPPAWGWLAHVLPNPAGMTAIRGIEFFSGYGTGQAFVVLSVYAAASVAVMLAMVAIPAARRRQPSGDEAGIANGLAAEAAGGSML